jgi:hypothetical protein
MVCVLYKYALCVCEHIYSIYIHLYIYIYKYIYIYIVDKIKIYCASLETNNIQHVVGHTGDGEGDHFGTVLGICYISLV